MNERERLAELIHKAELAMWGKPVGDAKSQREFIADYLLNHGIIAPPCKVGDAVYEVDTIGNRVNRFVINDLYHLGRLIDDECFGTLVFLTREEAEAALVERRKA